MKTLTQLKKLYKNAPNGVFTLGDIRILDKYISQLQPGETYLEIGVDKGRSLWCAKQLAPEVNCVGVEIHTEPVDWVGDVEFIKGDSQEVAKSWDREIALLFIDGDHYYEGVKKDIESWYPHVKPGGIILFHDFRSDIIGVPYAMTEFCYKNNIGRWEFYNNFHWDEPEDRVNESFMAMLVKP